MAKGWIKLHRSIMDNEMWLSEPFTKSQAWIDLILLADHEDNGEYQKGCIYKSLRFLADRWKWSRDKVRHYLLSLEQRGMIHRKLYPNGQVITLVKYGFYQSGDTSKPTLKPTLKPTQNATPNQAHTRNKEYTENVQDINACTNLEDREWDPMELWERMKAKDEASV